MGRTVRHTTWIWLGKVLLASVIAFTALSLLCLVCYKLLPPVVCTDGVTFYKYKPNWRYSLMIGEGYARGKTNNEGYLCINDFDENTKIDVLVIGSSHMEALQMPMECSAASLLDEWTGKTVYNIGISSHSLMPCVLNLSSAIKKYKPSQFVVLETSTIELSNQEMDAVLYGEYPKRMPDFSRIRELGRQVPLVQLMWRQTKELLGMQEVNPVFSTENGANDPKLLNTVLSRIHDETAAFGAKAIIVYHPSMTLEEDGSVTVESDEQTRDEFSQMCEENGLYYLDLTDRFLEEYYFDHVVPYGFADTAIMTGHLNRYGHKMVAEELYALMQEEGL